MLLSYKPIYGKAVDKMPENYTDQIIVIRTCETLRTLACKRSDRVNRSKQDTIASNEAGSIAEFEDGEAFLVVETGFVDADVIVERQHLQLIKTILVRFKLFVKYL